MIPRQLGCSGGGRGYTYVLTLHMYVHTEKILTKCGDGHGLERVLTSISTVHVLYICMIVMYGVARLPLLN